MLLILCIIFIITINRKTLKSRLQNDKVQHIEIEEEKQDQIDINQLKKFRRQNTRKKEVKELERPKKRIKTRKQKILFITQLSILMAIEIVMCFTPMIGTIKIVPGSIEATISFLPAIIASIVLGPVAGSIMGGVAGACSFIYWTFVEPGNPSAMMFTPFHALPVASYWTLVICFVPRILTGLLPGLIFNYGNKIIKNNYVRSGISCVVASLTNTLLVLFGTYFLWGKTYASALGMNYNGLLMAIFTIIGTNGIAEVLFTTIVGIPLSKALLVVLDKAK